MPDIHFECPKCKQTLDAPEELATQLIECPICKETIEVPARSQRKEAPKPPEPPKPPKPEVVRATTLVFMVPPVKESRVARSLTILGFAEVILGVIGGISIGLNNSSQLGILVCVSGIFGGMMLYGFAQIIENTSQTSQRLQRLELIIQKVKDDDSAA